MDPYRDVGTGEDGEILRTLVRKRDETKEELHVPKRPRKSTNELLPPGLPDEPVLERLKREERLQDYTRERLEMGLHYICETLKRDVTTRTASFLALCKQHYRVALEEENPSEASCAVVQAMDQAYDSAAFFHKVREPSEAEFLNNFVKLRELENLLNYGDYLSQNLQEIRAKLRTEAGKEGPQQAQAQAETANLGRPRTWLDIADELKGADVNNLRKHVYTACDILNLDPIHMQNVIQAWGDRNRLARNKSGEYIEERKWASLAKQLCRDMKELPNIYTDPETRATYEKAMLYIQNEYFDVYDADNAEGWVPNANAVNLLKQMKEAREKKGKH